MFPHSCLEVRRQGDETVVRFADLDRLDESNGEAAGQALRHAEEVLAGGRLVLDLAAIRFVTSSALGKFVALNRKLRAAGGRLVLANPCPAVVEVLAVTGLDRVLEVCPAAGSEQPIGVGG